MNSAVSDRESKTAPEPTENRFQDALQVFVAASFGLAQPIFERLATRPTYLTDLLVRRVSIVALVAIFSLVIPATLVAIELVAGLVSRTLRQWLHSVFLTVLLTIFALLLLGRVRFLPAELLIGLALVFGAAAAVAIRFNRWARMFVSAASPAIALFPAWLLFISPVSRVMFPQVRESTVTVGKPLPVVLVIFDEFCGAWLMNDEGEIDAVHFPNFAALAHEATWFRNATSVSFATEYAVPAILTGNYQDGRRRSDVLDHPINLFTLLLAAKSHDLVVFEPHTRLFPDQADPDIGPSQAMTEQVRNLVTDLSIVYFHQFTPVDFRRSLPVIPRRWFGMLPEYVVRPDKRAGVIRYSWDLERDRQVDHFLKCIGPTDRPPLYFLHVVVPHFPWTFLPSGRKHRHDRGLTSTPSPLGVQVEYGAPWEADELAVAQGLQQYVLQVGYVDHLLGRITERLKSTGLYGECLFIVVADHGVVFRANERPRSTAPESLAELMSIPLFIKLPHQISGTTDDRNVESIDVLPTITHFLDTTPRVECDGHSLLDSDFAGRPEKRFLAGSKFESVDSDFQSRFQAMRTLRQNFPVGPEPDAVIRVGPYGDWVGRSATDLDLTGRSDFEITLTEWQSNYSADPDDLVPCYIQGRVRPSPPANRPIHLAIAINNTVQAVVRTYQLPDLEDAWSAVVSEHSFRHGQNELRVFEVLSEDDRTVVRECGLSTRRPND